ncbi:MAG: class I SAM-dependent methyltransferase [Chloroflexi bacterium]|nr:class I SAM-dependent methyltransferase [Chloroflexota bacterium]
MNEMPWTPDLGEYETVLDERGIADLLGAISALAGTPGDIVECGSWRGGSAMIMGEFLRRTGDERLVYACDSYEGFDLDELRLERESGRTRERDDAFASTSLKYVQAKIRERDLEGKVRPVKGYFEETLPTLEGPFALALVDCDLHSSILYAACALWPKLSAGGMMLFDDYLNAEHFSGARAAVEQFLADHRDEIEDERLLSRLYRVRKARGATRVGALDTGASTAGA